FQGMALIDRECICPGGVRVLDGRGGDRDGIGTRSRGRRSVSNRCGVAISRASTVGRIAQRSASSRAGGAAARQGPVGACEVTVIVADGRGKNKLGARANRR